MVERQRGCGGYNTAAGGSGNEMTYNDRSVEKVMVVWKPEGRHGGEESTLDAE